MIYEVRTYDLKPRTLPQFLETFGSLYEHRRKYSDLIAFWYTEIGRLNRVIHVWPYADAAERARIRAEAHDDPNWPPPVADLIETMTSEIFVPFPFSPKLEPGDHGPVYELRSYVLRPGAIAGVGERWKPALPARTALSPLSVVMYSDVGALNKYIHIWPYKSLEQRAQVRAQALADGIWPPPPGGGGELVSQENMILTPAPFSPMQ